MTNVLSLNKKSNLVMPSHYVELDKEEMSYVEGGFYLDNTTVNNIMYYSLGVAGVGSAILGLGWSAVKSKLVAALGSIIIGLSTNLAATIIGLAVVGVVAITLACYGISFFEGIYTAQNKGTGVEMYWSWFHFKKKYY